MKRCLAALCLLLSAAVAHAQFEGQIDMKVTHGGGEEQRNTELSLLIKHGMMSIAAKGEAEGETMGNIIFRPDKNVLWVVNEKDKSYLEIVPDKNVLAHTKKERKTAQEPSALHKTGKTMTIAGYVCDEWVTQNDDNEETTIYGTTKLGNVYEGFRQAFAQWGGQQLEQTGEAWQRELIEKKIFPMKTVTKEGGAVTESQEVTKVEQRSLPDATFEPPSDFKKKSLGFDMQKLMKGLKEGSVRSMNKDELEQMMKQLKENMKGEDEDHDSTKHDDDDDDDQ